MDEWMIDVPTYYGAEDDQNPAIREDVEEHRGPRVPILLRREDGVRIVLGTHDYDDYDRPDLLIERRPNGWAIFLHPLGGGDPVGVVHFLDDGRSYFCEEPFTDPPLVMLRADEDLPE